MFIRDKTKTWSTGDGDKASGPFILLLQRSWDVSRETMPTELRVLIRKVQYSQLGNYMTGKLRLKLSGEDFTISLSGPFGNDNLPLECPEKIWPRAHCVPEEVARIYWHTTEGNEPGDGARAIYEWVVANFDNLQRFNKNDQTSRPSE